MYTKLIGWDIYEIKTTNTPIQGVMLRGRIRKLCLNLQRNILLENAEDDDNIVRFAVPTNEGTHEITNYLQSIIPDVTINLISQNIPNPVLSKLKVNLEERYSL